MLSSKYPHPDEDTRTARVEAQQKRIRKLVSDLALRDVSAWSAMREYVVRHSDDLDDVETQLIYEHERLDWINETKFFQRLGMGG